MFAASTDKTRTPPLEPRIQRPILRSAAQMAAIASSLPELDRYARYLYVLLCDHFVDTCAIAEHLDEMVGFVTGYRKPNQPDTLFVWQVATVASVQGRGVASALLDEILTRPANAEVRYVEATVSPGNRASRRLFEALAQRLQAPLHDLPGYGVELFPSPHAAEPLLRIGAFSRRNP